MTYVSRSCADHEIHTRRGDSRAVFRIRVRLRAVRPARNTISTRVRRSRRDSISFFFPEIFRKPVRTLSVNNPSESRRRVNATRIRLARTTRRAYVQCTPTSVTRSCTRARPTAFVRFVRSRRSPTSRYTIAPDS